MQTIPSLTVGEDPVERGRLHGARFAREVADSLETYLRRLEASGLARDAAEAEGLRWPDAMARQNHEYAAEMRGLAEGSGQSEGVIALLNARYEVAFTLFGKDARRREELLSVGPDGCSIYGLLPETYSNHFVGPGHGESQMEKIAPNALY